MNEQQMRRATRAGVNDAIGDAVKGACAAVAVIGFFTLPFYAAVGLVVAVIAVLAAWFAMRAVWRQLVTRPAEVLREQAEAKALADLKAEAEGWRALSGIGREEAERLANTVCEERIAPFSGGLQPRKFQ